MTAQDLKNSILQLAMQGKLVGQKSEEGTARELMKHNKFYGKGKEIKDDEKPYDIPDSWCWVRLVDIGDIVGGGTPKTAEITYWENGDIPWMTPADMRGLGKYVSCGERKITQIGLKNSSAKLMPKGTVIYSSRAPIGYIGIALNELCTNQGFKSLVPFNTELSEYLYYCLISRTQNIISRASGTTFKEISGNEFGQTVIPIPPLEEQKRIVAKIEELLLYIEKYEKAYSKLEVFNRQFPNAMQKSVLQYAMQGKLVEQKPEEGTGEELYCQIQTAKKQLIKAGTIRKEKSLPEISEAEKPFDIPTSWKWVRLADICEQKPVNGYSPKNVDYITEVKKLTLTATTAGYFKPDAFKYVDVDKDKVSKYWLKHNDLLIQRSNSRELVGTSCIYTGNDDEYIYPDLMMRVKILQGVELVYIDYVLKSPATRYYFSQKATGTSSSMPKINQDIVANTLIPLPPLQEQKRIVKELEKIIPYCEKLYMRLN